MTINVNVRVGYANNAWTPDANIAWYNIPADDLERVIIRRGRPVRGRVADIGRATITLINRIGDYDPEGERGRYGSAGNAFYSHPGKRIQVRWGTTVIFDGLIAAVRHNIDDVPERVIYECQDRMSLLRLRSFDFAAYTGAENVEATNVLNILPHPSFVAVVGANWRNVALPAERRSFSDRLGQMTTVTQAVFYVSRTGVITYRSYDHRYAAPSAVLTNDPCIDTWELGHTQRSILGRTTFLGDVIPRSLGGRVRIDEIDELILDAADIINIALARKPPNNWFSWPGGGNSLTKYDIREFRLESDIFASQTDAGNYAKWLVSEYQNGSVAPQTVTIRQPASIASLSTLDLFDVVTLEITARTSGARYDGTRVITALVSSLSYDLSGQEAQLVIGIEPTRGLNPLNAGFSAPLGTISEKVFV